MKPPSSSDTEPSVSHSISSGGQPSAKALYEQRKSYSKTMSSMGEVSEYKVEHLVTLTMERKEAVLTVEDTIRKLQLLDARGKVWKQDIFLMVDNKAVKLADCETKDELEVFPLSSLQHVQPVIDACSYNSICALVVKDTDQKTPDIHLFQCSNVPADVIYADISSALQDIKSKKGRKSRPDTLRRHRETIEARSQLPTTPPINVKDRVEQWTKTVEAQNETTLSLRPTMNGQPETPEMLAFKIHRDVQMLNHAFDDIEAFVSLLQKSAEATRELTLRQSRGSSRKSSKRGKGRPPGSGIMQLRAKLPPKEQFIDCFQKFRFCFNLLCKLKLHVKDPNAVELVHYLFQPLGLIIHTCSGPDLARSIKCPLLFKDTIDFLRNCATTQELSLWRELGDFWTKCRSEFPKDMYFPPYVPHFASGWVPPPIPSMEAEPRELAATIQEQADQVQRAEEEWKAKGSNIEDALMQLSSVPPPENSSPRRISSFDGSDTSAAFKQHVRNHVARNQAAQSGPSPRKLCRAMYDFSARNDHELSVELDDLLVVLDDSKGWWKVQNQEGESGFVPESLVLLISSASKNPPSAAPETPKHFIPPPPPAPAVKVPPPPPAPKLQPVPVTAASLNGVKLRQTRDNPPAKKVPHSLQEELKTRVTSQKQRNFVLPKKGASSNAVLVNKSSTAKEVRAWIHSLGFSLVTLDSLGILDGAQLFSLTKEEIKEICGEEGARMNSQLMMQRHHPEFATVSKNSELGRIMAKRRGEIMDA